MDDVDVVVVGAGAAGLAAGERLRAAGARFVVLEAKDRVGGRAYTETDAFGVPFDHGCHWLHSASINPFVPIADRLGHRYERIPAGTRIRMHLGDRWAEEQECQAAWGAVLETWERAAACATGGRDVAFSEVLDHAGPWERLARHWVALMTSLDPQDVSALDYARYEDTGENWPVADGYGALVRRAAGDLPVRCGVAVTSVEAEGDGVRVETAGGTLRARAAIVTVSLAVLASERIRIGPRLGDAKLSALDDVRLGHAEKVAIGFDRDVFGVPATTYFQSYASGDQAPHPVNFQLRPAGHEMAIGHLGGRLARDLAAAGPGAMTEVVLDALAAAFGGHVRASVRTVVTTGWGLDPHVGGAYSGARPGRAAARAWLATPVAERIFIAGEATSLDAFSTAHGARREGERAAELALHRMRRRDDTGARGDPTPAAEGATR